MQNKSRFTRSPTNLKCEQNITGKLEQQTEVLHTAPLYFARNSKETESLHNAQ